MTYTCSVYPLQLRYIHLLTICLGLCCLDTLIRCSQSIRIRMIRAPKLSLPRIQQETTRKAVSKRKHLNNQQGCISTTEQGNETGQQNRTTKQDNEQDNEQRQQNQWIQDILRINSPINRTLTQIIMLHLPLSDRLDFGKTLIPVHSLAHEHIYPAVENALSGLGIVLEVELGFDEAVAAYDEDEGYAGSGGHQR
jgi:hypothetical protein